MKILFLGVLLVNIVFFIWEYRKGAPDIYLPPSYENDMGSKRQAQKILLLSELTEVKERGTEVVLKQVQQSEVLTDADVANRMLSETKQPVIVKNKVAPIQKSSVEKINKAFAPIKQKSELEKLNNLDVVQVSAQQETKGVVSNIQEESFSAVVCYQLVKGDYAQNTFTHELEDSDLTIELFEQQQRDISHYLVLTSAANSYQEALNREQEIKQQGIKDIRLFKQGPFNLRISLGLFSKKEQAFKAKELFSKQTDKVLEVVPDYLTTSITVVKISTQNEQEINAFEKNYSMIVEQEVECSKDTLTGSHVLGTSP